MSRERLLEIKSQIDAAKTSQAEVAGQIKSETDRMEQRFGVKTVSDAKRRLEKIGVELDNKESKFSKGMEKLESAHDWD